MTGEPRGVGGFDSDGVTVVATITISAQATWTSQTAPQSCRSGMIEVSGVSWQPMRAQGLRRAGSLMATNYLSLYQINFRFDPGCIDCEVC